MRTQTVALVITLVAASTSLATIGDTKEKVEAKVEALGGASHFIPAKGDKPAAMACGFDDGTCSFAILNSNNVVMAEGATFLESLSPEDVGAFVKDIYPSQTFKIEQRSPKLVFLKSEEYSLFVRLTPPFMLLIAVKEEEDLLPLICEVLEAGAKAAAKPQPTPKRPDNTIRIKYYPPSTPAPGV